MNQYAQAIVTVLSLVNPVVCGVLFVQATGGRSRSEQIADATKTALIVMTILCLAAVAGARLLTAFGISFDAFQVAGGMVLAWMGFLMLRGASLPTTNKQNEDNTASLTPLIIFAASPGTITGVITISVAHSDTQIPVTVLVAVVVAIAITWLVMIAAAASSGEKRQGLMHDVTTRFMGMIVLAMGIQFSLTGLKAFFEV